MSMYCRACRVLYHPAISLVLLLVSCRTAHYKLYSGPALPKEETAVITTDWGYRWLANPVEIIRIDGQDISSWWKLTMFEAVEVLPGHHTVELSFGLVVRAPTAYLPGLAVYPPYALAMELDAEPGHKYLVYSSGTISELDDGLVSVEAMLCDVTHASEGEKKCESGYWVMKWDR